MPFLGSVAQLPQRFNVGPLTLHRPTADKVQNEYGGFDDAADSTLDLDPVSVVDASALQLEQLPEADRHRKTIQIIATVRLYASDGGKLADRVEYQGRTYRVVSVEDYELAGGVWLALAQAEEVTA
jgi:hypothetical protein